MQIKGQVTGTGVRRGRRTKGEEGSEGVKGDGFGVRGGKSWGSM